MTGPPALPREQQREFPMMQQLREVREAVFENGSAVLMARIVDDSGVCIRPDQVAAVGYSIYEVDRCDPDERTVVGGHDCVALDVDEVLLDALETGGLWEVDVAGYNFCHQILANPDGSFPRLGAEYEIRYVFIPEFGDSVIVRFFVRLVSR